MNITYSTVNCGHKTIERAHELAHLQGLGHQMNIFLKASKINSLLSVRYMRKWLQNGCLYKSKVNMKTFFNFKYCSGRPIKIFFPAFLLCHWSFLLQFSIGRFSPVYIRTIVHTIAGLWNNFQDHSRLPLCILRIDIDSIGPLRRVTELIFS